MPCLKALGQNGGVAELQTSFPCVTWPAQATLLTGQLPNRHGIVANGFYWRDVDRVEMWTAGNETIEAPQVWDRLRELDQGLTSAVWFPMLSKGCSADYVCMPAPIHNPDGSESLWCYTRPVELYGELRDALGHFPLKNFWGPLASIPSSQWIVDSALMVARKQQPDFFYIYLPHLDYMAQRDGPDSEAAGRSLSELDAVIGGLVTGMEAAYGDHVDWMVASEYTIQPVEHVSYPNRLLRAAGLLAVRDTDDGERLDTGASRAWCLVDHQFSHVFVKDADSATVRRVVEILAGADGIAEVLAGEARRRYAMDHPRAGEVVVLSEPHSWQAYYYWEDDRRAPAFARTVDIHQKPGYDPVELCFDPATKSIPLDATRIRGSHGLPPVAGENQALVLCSDERLTARRGLRDVEVAEQIVSWFRQDRQAG